MSQYSYAYSWAINTAIREIMKENPSVTHEEIATTFYEQIKSRAERLALYRMSREVRQEMVLEEWERKRKEKATE